MPRPKPMFSIRSPVDRHGWSLQSKSTVRCTTRGRLSLFPSEFKKGHWLMSRSQPIITPTVSPLDVTLHTSWPCLSMEKIKSDSKNAEEEPNGLVSSFFKTSSVSLLDDRACNKNSSRKLELKKRVDRWWKKYRCVCLHLEWRGSFLHRWRIEQYHQAYYQGDQLDDDNFLVGLKIRTKRHTKIPRSPVFQQ